jgi:ribosome maturation factor RimP
LLTDGKIAEMRGYSMKKVTEIVAELAAPVAAEFGCELWDTEYVREAGQWFLRLYLDKDGGVDILDCENVSRRVSDLLDEADPIEGSYIFEVSSAGAERQLKRPSDFEKFLGSPVLLKTYQNRDGRKEFPGVLKEYDGGAVVLEMGKQELRFEKNEVAMVRLRIVF